METVDAGPATASLVSPDDADTLAEIGDGEADSVMLTTAMSQLTLTPGPRPGSRRGASSGAGETLAGGRGTRAAHKKMVAATHRKSVAFKGTPNYMPPEAIRSEEVDTYSDIWSVGCTVWEMFTGKRPWHVRVG